MIGDNIKAINSELPSDVMLVAVSKFHPVSELMQAYDAGQRVFAENRPQELMEKVPAMPADVVWHFIGHLQTNKLKMVLPYVSMVQSVDSLHLLQAIEKWCASESRSIDVLLEIHIGAEQTKQGFYEEEALDVFFDRAKYPHINFRGLMGMASHTDDESVINADFQRISSFMDYIRELFPEIDGFDQLSIGMTGDWRIALDYGTTMVRIGTGIFGERSNKNK